MEKDFHKDSLEEYFRKSLAGFGEKSSQDAWDAPSNQVWENIKSGIPVHPSLSGASIYKLKWFLTAIALLLFFISYQLYTYNKKLDRIVSQVRENRAVIDALQEAGNAEEAGTEKLGFHQNQSEEDAMSPFPDAKKISPQASNFVDAENHLGGLAKPRQEKGAIVPPVSILRQKMNPPDSQSKPKYAFTDRNRSEVDNSVEFKNQFVTDELNEKTGSFKGSSEAGNREGEKGGSQEKDAPSNAVVGGIATKGSNVIMAKKNPPVSNFSTARKQADAENPIFPPASIALLEIKTIFSHRDLPPLENRNIPDYGTASQKKENIHPERLSLGVYFSPTYSYRSLTSKISGATQSFDEEASGKLSYNLGIQLGYNLTRRWTLFSGLKYHNLNQTSLHRIGLRYTRVGGSIENGRFVNAYNAELKTSFGDAKIEIRIADETPDAAIPEGRPIPVLLKASQHLEYLGIPLLVEYRLGGSKFAFSIKGGFVGNFLVQRGLEITAVTPLNDRLIYRRTDIKSERVLRQLKDFTLDMQLGVGLHFGLSKNLQLIFEPTYQRNLTPVFENQRFKTNTFTLAINSGLRFHF